MPSGGLFRGAKFRDLHLYREYGDATMWRPLATFNRIDDPLRVRLGTTLLLPTVDDLMGGA